jgi:hypothetical protein
MIAIEKKIESFYQETEESFKVVIEGSDEHLDLILSIVKPLQNLTVHFKELNQYLVETIDKTADDDLRSIILPKLLQLNRSCYTLRGTTVSHPLYRDIREALKDYIKEHELLREIIHDLQNIRLSNDEEFDLLLNELNDI